MSVPTTPTQLLAMRKPSTPKTLSSGKSDPASPTGGTLGAGLTTRRSLRTYTILFFAFMCVYVLSEAPVIMHKIGPDSLKTVPKENVFLEHHKNSLCVDGNCNRASISVLEEQSESKVRISSSDAKSKCVCEGDSNSDKCDCSPECSFLEKVSLCAELVGNCECGRDEDAMLCECWGFCLHVEDRKRACHKEWGCSWNGLSCDVQEFDQYITKGSDSKEKKKQESKDANRSELEENEEDGQNHLEEKEKQQPKEKLDEEKEGYSAHQQRREDQAEQSLSNEAKSAIVPEAKKVREKPSEKQKDGEESDFYDQEDDKSEDKQNHQKKKNEKRESSNKKKEATREYAQEAEQDDQDANEATQGENSG